METSRLALIVKLWAVWALIAVLAAGLDGLGWIRVVRWVGEPVVNWLSSMGGRAVAVVEQPFDTVRFWHTGAVRMAALEQRLAAMAVENEQLKSRFMIYDLGFKNKSTVKVLADADKLLIEKMEGVREGSVVLDEAGVLLGKVIRVGQFTAAVERPFDAGAKIAVKVGESTGLVEGDGASAQLTGVLQAESLAVGDVVVTSGVDDQFPPGIVIGQVSGITGRPADVTKGGKVELLGKVGERLIVY